MEVSEQPFPLKRHFRRRIVPGLVIFIVLLATLAGTGANRVMKAIYLELAENRAAAIARGVAAAEPAAWELLLAGNGAASAAALTGAFAREAEEFDLARLKVYDLERRVIFATDPAEIGSTEQGAALGRVIDEGQPGIVGKTDADGSELYELYVPLLDAAGRLRAVFELYEPIGYLDAILLRSALPVVIIPALLLLALTAGLAHLVSRAQADIDARTRALNALRRRIETFVSASAVDAARGAGAGGSIPSRTLTCSLLYSDVRDFSGFAEGTPPEDVVRFLNDLMAEQVAAVGGHGGDVDKMIGDAVLAWFDGDGAQARALAAARDILERLQARPLARGVGIGVFTGEVVCGAVGPAERRDFTVIGDSVNIAARLCAAAAAGELVADAASVAAAGDSSFADAETIHVKGRRESLSVRRWKIS